MAVRDSVHAERIKNIPLLPGIYIFKNQAAEIIYIGKAKSLRKRVSSYFIKQANDWKVSALISDHATIDYIVTHSELEANLLEAQLIKEYQPKYNTLLKSGDPFLYILFSDDEAGIPSLSLVRIKKKRGIHFGPFMHKRQARSAYDYLVRTFKLYRCTYKVAAGCLDFHLGRCAGTCRNEFDAPEYRTRMELARQALEGNAPAFLQIIQQQIRHYSQQLEFEKAQHLTEYVQNLDTIFATLKAKFTEKKYAKEIAHATISPDAHLVPALAPEALKDLGQLLRLAQVPRTIDCFDISHFQSSYMVGSCIRFTDGVPERNKFRRFKINTLTQQNDYAALQEVITRRYRNPADIPDVILIDGGKGQLSAARQVLPEATIVSLAKREETLYGPLFMEGKVLDLHTALGQLLIAMRDYAHHFAVSYHQLLRKKGATR